MLGVPNDPRQLETVRESPYTAPTPTAMGGCKAARRPVQTMNEAYRIGVSTPTPSVKPAGANAQMPIDWNQDCGTCQLL